MEVHHHTHTERKKWTHYFREFFMMFLAITLSFFVENRREHYIEHLRSRQYAISLVEDLSKDTLAIGAIIKNYNKSITKINEFRSLLKEKQLNKIPAGTLYYYCEPAIWSIGITFHDATIQQLKNSGNLRYFSPLLQYEISEYDRNTREISRRQENEVYFSRTTREMMTGIFNSEQIIQLSFLSTPEIEKFKQTELQLLTKDTLIIRKLINEIIYRHASWEFRLKEVVLPTFNSSIELLMEIKKEYNLN